MVLNHERTTLGHAVVFLLVMLASPAISKDSGILTRMLYAAFLAEQDVAVCIVADPAFASETSGPMGYMRDYAIHIKAEVTAGLNETETLSLLKSAADRAKAAQADHFIRTLPDNYETVINEEATNLSKMRYRGGATSYLEVLDSDTRYFVAQLGLARADLNELLSFVNLYSALGGGWE
jgi:hypothetical protein